MLRGKVKSQEGRERREGIEVQVSTGYWLPGWVLTGNKKFHGRQNICIRASQVFAYSAHWWPDGVPEDLEVTVTNLDLWSMNVAHAKDTWERKAKKYIVNLDKLAW